MLLPLLSRDTDAPALTLEQIQDAWENIKKRIKQKNNQTAAMLNYYTVVGVDGSVEPFLVVIRARTKVFYEHMQQGDRVKYVEWGLGMEFGRKFRVQLLLPEQTVPPPPVSRSTNVAPSAAPQQSAHRERPHHHSKLKMLSLRRKPLEMGQMVM